jgi:hypothetical protein
MPARLFTQARLRFQDVTVSRPAVGRTTRYLAVTKVRCCGATMPRGKLELGGRVLVELRLGGESLESLAQFQTLTSR